MTLAQLVRFWLPLATSWLMMAVEWPMVNAFVARTPGARTQLAGLGVAISLAVSITAPVVSFLTVGNALSRDWRCFCLLRRFVLILGITFSAASLLVVASPALDVIVVRVIGSPPQVAPNVRAALWGLSLWPVAIAYRRFFQGLMIRHGHTRPIGTGTVMRLGVSAAVAGLGLAWGRLEGAALGGLTLGVSACAEAVYIHVQARRVVARLRSEQDREQEAPLDLKGLLRFYVPLALTSMVGLSTAPLISAGLARAPYPVASLAAWPVVDGQLFVLRSFGLSLQEVVVAQLKGTATMRTLERFATLLALGALTLLLVVAFSPLAGWWQREISGLDVELTAFAVNALRYAVLLPVLAVTLSLWRGVVVTAGATAAIAQAMLVNLCLMVATLLLGARLGSLAGASLASVALTIARTGESLWLWRAARAEVRWRLRGAAAKSVAS